ncbi:hypothetical protein V6O07_10340 [Arthrospira platensis SPKY2]
MNKKRNLKIIKITLKKDIYPLLSKRSFTFYYAWIKNSSYNFQTYINNLTLPSDTNHLNYGYDLIVFDENDSKYRLSGDLLKYYPRSQERAQEIPTWIGKKKTKRGIGFLNMKTANFLIVNFLIPNITDNITN